MILAFMNSQDGGDGGAHGIPSIEPLVDGRGFWMVRRVGLGIFALPSGSSPMGRSQGMCGRLDGLDTVAPVAENMSMSTTVSFLSLYSEAKNISVLSLHCKAEASKSSRDCADAARGPFPGRVKTLACKAKLGHVRLRQDLFAAAASHSREPHSSFRMPAGGDRPTRSLCTV